MLQLDSMEPLHYKQQSYDDFYIFECDEGKIRCLKADYDFIRDRRAEWIRENPKPDPPLIPVTPDSKNWNFKLSRKARELKKRKDGMSIEECEQIIASQADPVADPDSDEYKKMLAEYEWARFVFVEQLLLTKYVLYDINDEYMTLEDIVMRENTDIIAAYLNCETMRIIKAISNTSSRLDLNKYFIEISTLTWEKVLRSGDSIGLLWRGNPVLRSIPKSGGTSGGGSEEQSIWGLGVLAAAKIGMSPRAYKEESIDSQAEILAQFLIEKWLERFNQQEQALARARGQGTTNPEGSYRTQ